MLYVSCFKTNKKWIFVRWKRLCDFSTKQWTAQVLVAESERQISQPRKNPSNNNSQHLIPTSTSANRFFENNASAESKRTKFGSELFKNQ
jgi:hypothetical protein